MRLRQRVLRRLSPRTDLNTLQRATAQITRSRMSTAFAQGVTPPKRLHVSAKATATNKPGKVNSGRLTRYLKLGGSNAITTQPPKASSPTKNSNTDKLLTTGSYAENIDGKQGAMKSRNALVGNSSVVKLSPG